MQPHRWLKELIRPYYLRWFYFPIRPARRPAEFRECWKYPYEAFTRAAHLPPAPAKLPDLLVYPMTDWHSRTQRTQQLVRAFARLGFRCIYVNPHLGREFEQPALFDPAHRLARLEDNIYELHIHLPREPVFHERLLTASEERIAAEAIRGVLPESAAAIQLLSFPLWLGVARRFRAESGFPIIYDCHDLLSGFRNISHDLISAEGALLREADLTLFSSCGLIDRHAAGTRRALLLRNAVAAAEFEKAGPPSGAPVAGYVGALDSWFDIEAVREAAVGNPQCRFLFAGRIDYAPIRELESLPNVEFVGEIPYSAVPGFMAQFRAALIPFRVEPLTLMTNPIKLYEYFSLGLPVVSAPLPEAQAMAELVYIADSPAAFARQVGVALKEEDCPRRMRRKEIARQESWSARADELYSEFEKLGWL
jgi:glycosyltransferase involved in cell wall biosynthesis